jgi:glutaconyl-CoA decarboxylase
MRRYTLQIGEREFVLDVEELDTDRFQVQVGGEPYEVTLSGDEHLAEATITPAVSAARMASAPAAAKVAAKAAAPVAAAPAPAARKAARGGGTNSLNAPMPGVILEVSVAAGDTVERGQEVAVLEAMKMNNSIKSPRAGVVAEVCVEAGQAVGHGDAIVRFKEG